MIKTATQSAQQETNPETAGYSKESSGGSKVATREQSANIKNQPTIGRQQSTATEQIANLPSYPEVQKELEERTRQLNSWQDKLNELMNDPNNADKVVNYLSGLQFLKNKIAELKSQQQLMTVSANGYSFQDNQSVLHAGSVRRKDKEALEDLPRYDSYTSTY